MVDGLNPPLQIQNKGIRYIRELAMHAIKIDLKQGLVSVDSAPIAVDEKGVLTASISKFCSPPIQTDEGRIQYRFIRKASVYGKSTDVVIEVGEGRLYAVTFLFDLIEFFGSSVLESKILKTLEKSLNINFTSDHPSTAFYNFCKFGQARFFYDAKQGDLSLNVKFEHGTNESTLKL